MSSIVLDLFHHQLYKQELDLQLSLGSVEHPRLTLVYHHLRRQKTKFNFLQKKKEKELLYLLAVQI